MEDKSLFAKKHPKEISEGLQGFIDSMVEEIVLEGKPFGTQKKYLKKFSENEGLDYGRLEKNICTFIDIISDLKVNPSRLMEKFAVEKGHECKISDTVVENLLSELPQNVRIEIFDSSTGKYGFIDLMGNIVIEPQFCSCGNFHDGLAPVVKDRKWGYINCHGEEAVPFIYEIACDYAEGMAAVRRSSKWGFIDKTGREVVPRRYSGDFHLYSFFSEGLAVVAFKHKYGYVDKTGNEVIPLQYDWAGRFSEGLACVRLPDGPPAIINKENKVLFFLYFDEIGCHTAAFSDGMLSVAKDLYSGTKWGFVNKEGTEIISCRYDDVDDFYEGMAVVRLDGKYGFIDTEGQQVVPCHFDYACKYSGGLACVMDKYKYGFIDKNGNYVVPCIYDDANSFSEGLAAVKLNDKWGFIDKTGKEIIPCKYEPVWGDTEHTSWTSPSFKRGLAMISINDRKAYINKIGDVVWIQK